MKKFVRKWAVSILCCVVIVITALVSAWQWTRATSDGQVHIGTPKTPAAPVAVVTQPMPLSTPYFTTMLPGDFAVKRQVTAPSDAVLLQLVATSKHQQFAVTIRPLLAEGLAGLGDYNLRTTQTTTYEPYRPAGLPIEATAFRSVNGPPEFTVFWPHGAVVAEISMSSDGASTLAELFTSFVRISHSWGWQ